MNSFSVLKHLQRSYQKLLLFRNCTCKL